MKIQPSQSDFHHWRNPRRGTSNPERMDNPFWQWCVQTRESAYAANEKFNGSSSMGNGPCWCFQRIGQAHITLPDGRDVFIGGEHEDYYDPDFYIYNDVVIVDGEQVNIYGYPESDFPPTDFHTATLVEKAILIIGNLGYPDDRRIGETQVLRLDLDSFEIFLQPTTGANPGWLHDHSSKFNETNNSIRVTGGKRYTERISENFHDFELCLNSFEWRVAIERNWKSWILEREDGDANELWQIRQESWNRKLGLSTKDHLAETLEGIPDEIIAEMTPNVIDRQIEEIENLYRSPFGGSLAIEDDENYGRYRLSIDEVIVRFDESMYGVTVTVEGELPDSKTDSLLSQLKQRLESIEQTEYKTTTIET